MVITLQLFLQGEPCDFNDEEWCANLNMWASQRQVFENGTTCTIQVDIGVDIDGLVHDAFIIANMLNDGQRWEWEGEHGETN